MTSDAASPESAPSGDPHRRRKRYSGTHPRRFDQRYKELSPQRYPELRQRVIEQGRTPAGSHRPVLLAETLDVLGPRPGDTVADCTLGYGGHAGALLERIGPPGLLLGLDVDAAELDRAQARLVARFPQSRVRCFCKNFAGLPGVLAEAGVDGCDVILADLGVSSMQIDDPARGFSYSTDGPLDMRLNQRRARTAAGLLAKIREDELRAALSELADEPDAAAITRHIIAARRNAPITRTGQLVELVLEAKGLPRRWRRDTGESDEKTHPAARTFQALRMLVNDELAALREFLRVVPDCLRPAGRLAVISFHSGEGRLVKHALVAGRAAGVYRRVADDPVRPGPAERRSNPRSAAARLRWAVRAASVDAGASEFTNERG